MATGAPVVTTPTDQSSGDGDPRGPSFGTTFTSVPTSVARGERASVAAHTGANVRCDLAVEYRTGLAGALDSPPSQKADQHGDVAWSWIVNGTAPTGQATVFANCGRDIVQASFDVTL